MNYFMLMFKLCLNFNHRHFHGNTLERCAFSFLDTILSGFLLLYLFIYLLPQTYIHIKQIKDYIEEKGNAVLPLPACISPLMSTNQSTSDSCCMWTWPRLHTAVLSVPPCTKKKKSLSLFYLSAISCYRLENRWKELNKADLQQIATIFQNYICFSYVRAWLVIVWSKHGLVDSSLFSSHCDSSTVAVRNDKHVTWTA